VNLVRRHADCFDAWELAGSWEEAEEIFARFSSIRSETGLPVYFSKLRSNEELEGSGEKYYHVINHGFGARDTVQIGRLADIGFDGAVFRMASTQSLWNEIMDAEALCKDHGLKASIHVRMSATNPATFRDDDRWAAHRIAEALIAAVSADSAKVFIDTFEDSDRGYFPRIGVVDRRFNPRPGFYVVRHLHAALNASAAPICPGRSISEAKARIVTLNREKAEWVLVLPEKSLDRVVVPGLAAGARVWQAIDLATGEILMPTVAMSKQDIEFGLPSRLEGPLLLRPLADGLSQEANSGLAHGG